MKIIATIKSYTDISQSNKLAEILPLESADMFYCYGMDIETKEWSYDETPTIEDESYKRDIGDTPCWSLAVLLDILPNGVVINKDTNNGKYHVSSTHIGTYITADNLIDACYDLILKLYGRKIL